MWLYASRDDGVFSDAQLVCTVGTVMCVVRVAPLRLSAELTRVHICALELVIIGPCKIENYC